MNSNYNTKTINFLENLSNVYDIPKNSVDFEYKIFRKCIQLDHSGNVTFLVLNNVIDVNDKKLKKFLKVNPFIYAFNRSLESASLIIMYVKLNLHDKNIALSLLNKKDLSLSHDLFLNGIEKSSNLIY